MVPRWAVTACSLVCCSMASSSSSSCRTTCRYHSLPARIRNVTIPKKSIRNTVLFSILRLASFPFFLPFSWLFISPPAFMAQGRKKISHFPYAPFFSCGTVTEQYARFCSTMTRCPQKGTGHFPGTLQFPSAPLSGCTQSHYPDRTVQHIQFVRCQTGSDSPPSSRLPGGYPC